MYFNHKRVCIGSLAGLVEGILDELPVFALDGLFHAISHKMLILQTALVQSLDMGRNVLGVNESKYIYFLTCIYIYIYI